MHHLGEPCPLWSHGTLANDVIDMAHEVADNDVMDRHADATPQEMSSLMSPCALALMPRVEVHSVRRHPEDV